MANIKSAKKRTKQIQVRTLRNKMRKSRIHTFLRALEESIAAGNKETAQESFKTMMSEFQRAVTKGVMKKTTASRKISRMNARVKAM